MIILIDFVILLKNFEKSNTTNETTKTKESEI